MRKRFEVQLSLGQTPIEKVILPLKSRDELPPILAGLQWIYQTPEVNEPIFTLLEGKVLAGKKATGRRGLDLWQILVLGVVRLGLDCDYDRLEHLANYDSLLREILGLSPVQGMGEKRFHHKTLSQNVDLVDEALLGQINAIVAQAGRRVFKKKGPTPEPVEAKVDTYVLESNVHFPTDLNLLWDAQRKCLDWVERLCVGQQMEGWRKAKDWRRKLKGQMRAVSRIHQGGGKDKARRQWVAVKEYLEASVRMEAKVFAAWREMRERALSVGEIAQRMQLEYFHNALLHQMDLVERRLVNGETIPHAEKVFSWFEPHTEWIMKGKLFPPVELGHKLMVTTDQHELILDYKVLDHSAEVEELIPLADRLLNRYGEGQVKSLSADQGFSRQEDRQLLELYIPEVVVPKRGRRNQEEEQRENRRTFRALRHQHSAVESDIHCLEHHGLNRCPDKGRGGYGRYVGYGVLAYNLHKIGAHLLRERARDCVMKMAA
jgi:transposase, IS5 family